MAYGQIPVTVGQALIKESERQANEASRAAQIIELRRISDGVYA